MGQVLKQSLAKNAKIAKVLLGELSVFAYRDVGEGREQDAEAWREEMIFFMPRQSETLVSPALVEPTTNVFVHCTLTHPVGA